MLRHVAIGWVCLSLVVGCSPKPLAFNPQKHPDVKRIALTRYDNVTIQQQYTKSVADKYPLARPLNAKRGGAPVAAAGFMIPDPTGGIIAGTILAVGLTVAAAEADVANRRTQRLNANGLHEKVAVELQQAIQSRLGKLGYAVTPVAPLAYESFDSAKPIRLGRSLPTMGKSKAAAEGAKFTKQGDLLLVLNTLTMGVEQRDKFGQKPTFHPFVIVGVRGYRMDTGLVVARFELVSVAPTPLPIRTDLDAAIADKAVLKKAYEEAIRLAVDEIAGDFDKSDGTIQLAKPDKAKTSAKAK